MRASLRANRKWLMLGGGVALSALFLYLSFRSVAFGEVAGRIARIHLAALVIAPTIRLTNFGVMALRSRVLFAPLRVFSFRRLFNSVLLAYAVNNVVPLRAGDLARIGYLARYGELPVTSCLAVVALERLLDLLVLALIVAFTVPLIAVDLPLGGPFYALVAVVVVTVGGALAISRSPDGFRRLATWLAGWLGASVRTLVERKAEAFAGGLTALRSARAVAAVVGLSLAFWGIGVCSVTVWLWAFDLALPWYAPVVVLAFLSFGLAIPSTPGNVGTFHFFASSALLTLGVGQTDAASFAVLVHAMAVVPFTLLAVPLLWADYAEAAARARDSADDSADDSAPDSTRDSAPDSTNDAAARSNPSEDARA